ncbi:hypothetical protein CXF72_13340 [Psychromonas sp. MB-3u-54]|uniref:hypothetical protein n=1 Tax=Psychromonas sp. MB-3u-54 TaxID=2058319 RepID=UPI000C32D784|nr:hypothetical protein [Psychromonas sp. MB-3u-54]PKH02095.1 hypothetical protein CXF72_13340 [Psychromonas sp. MB-3u-54]
MESFKKIIINIDWYFARILRWMFETSIYVALIFIGAMVLILVFQSLIEYGEGLSDLSMSELLFCGLLLILILRYIFIIKRTSVKWYNAITKPFIVIASFAVITSLFIGVIAIPDIMKGSSVIRSLTQTEVNILQVISFSIVLLSFYIAVPSPSLRLDKELNTSKSDNEKYATTHVSSSNTENNEDTASQSTKSVDEIKS